MLTTRIIARLDVKAPQGVVKGRRMDGLRRVGPVAEVAQRAEAEGADEVLYVDLVASLYERPPDWDMVAQAAGPLYVPLTVAGGIRSVGDVRQALQAGADKVAINTAALARPVLLRECAQAFGSQAIVVAIDAKRCGQGWEAYTRGGREPSGRPVVEWAQEAVGMGAGEVLLTSVDCDGVGQGTDVACVRAVAQAVPDTPLITCGGIGEAAHAQLALEAGADAIALASAFHGQPGLLQFKAELAHAGVVVRW